MTANELLWYASRSTGLASIVLLTVVLALGVRGPIRRAAPRRGPLRLSPAALTRLHRTLALGMVCFLSVHVLTAVVETYVDIGWLSAVVPFTSGYEPLSIGLGTLALDLLVAVMATALLRRRLPPGAWRVVHRAAYALWPIAALHGLTLGTTEPVLLRYVTVVCIAAGVFAITRRLMASRSGAGPTPGRGAARPAHAGARRPQARSSPAS